MLTEIIQDRAALLALEDEWRGLSARVSSSLGFFGSWDAVCHTIEVIQPEKWFVVTVRDPNTTRLVAVFGWERFNLQTPA